MKVFRFFILAVLFCSAGAHAQLANFNLEVSKTDETCLSNGTLSFSTTNLTSGSTVLYTVYLLPNTDNPVSVLEDNQLGGLSAGTYKVVATQALGNMSNTQEQQVTIVNAITPFSISVTSANQNCSAGGNIIVTANSGTPSSYEIISGPELRPLQTSNVFTGLPSGTYNVRAFNNCGVGIVKTHILSVVNTTLTISDPFYTETVMTQCDSITVSNTILATSGEIGYPIAIQHTLTPMDIGGNTIVINQNIENGPADEIEVSAVLPRYLNESYEYQLQVTDNCNTVYEKSDNTVNPGLNVLLYPGDATCAEKYIKMEVSKFYNSFTYEFLSFPDGFVPADFITNSVINSNEGYVEFGGPENSVPFGNYVVQVTDECGRTATADLMVEFALPTPDTAARNNGCFSEFGRLAISIDDIELVGATLVGAPAEYAGSLPGDVSVNINDDGILNLYDLPIGEYTLEILDECGFGYETTIEVPEFVEREFNAVTLPACSEGFGGVRISSGNGSLTEVLIVGAPTTLGMPLPYDVSFNIGDEFYMGNLPEGNYTFNVTDYCGINYDVNIMVEGYQPPAPDSFIFTPGCGSFSVRITDGSNGTEGANYWLQKYDSATGNWVHPHTGTVYTEGTTPNEDTGIKLRNNSTKNNLEYTGEFRILKKFETFSSGNSQNTMCVSYYGELEYYDGLSIGSAYNMACVGDPNDVYLEAAGYPISYKIIEKDGEPFVLDNGTSNVFVGLDPAIYVFSIEDACGNIVTQWFNFQELPSLAIITQPSDMLVCGEPGGTTETEFRLTDQNEQVLGSLFSSMYTITYHATQQDADMGINELPEYYTATTNGETIYVRLVHNEVAICHSITSFQLFTGDYVAPEITTAGTLCGDNLITLTADRGYDSYLWSTGETTRSIFVSEAGQYSVITERQYGSEICESYAEIEIIASEAPEITKIETTDWSEDSNTITVSIKGIGRYEYSIDGVNYQESNVFEGLRTGVYQVYVRDVFGCGSDNKEVVLMYYPKYFTPNGDNVNDKWYIKHAITEPHFEVEIYDKYGKLITILNSTSDGWDGTLKGSKLPSTDYWFLVTREDGRTLRGHFAMIR